MDDRKLDFEEKIFSNKIASEEAIFPPLVKAKNHIQNLKNT